MSKRKKLLRKAFRIAVFKRDDNRCRLCGDEKHESHDAHHITDRNEMPNGGYVVENGIEVCTLCHEKAEVFHSSEGEMIIEGHTPSDLYALINSSHEEAVKASNKLK